MPVKQKLVIMGGVIAILLIYIILIILQSHPVKQVGIPSARVKIIKPKLVSIAKTLTAYGTVNVAPEHIQQITIQNEAMVQQIYVTQGQHVSSGDPLLKLSTTASSNLKLQDAKIAVNYAKKELQRLEKLRSQFLATNAEVQTAKQNLAKAEAVLNNLLQQQINETGNVLKSTCNCNIVAINVQPGQVVAPATTLLTYANTNQVQIRLGIEYADLTKVRVGKKVVITPIYNSTESYEGTINNITDQMDPKTGLIDVIVPLGNVIGLIPGSMVEGKIYLEPGKHMLAVPRCAVLYENDKPYVYIDNNGKAEKRWVETGESDNDFIAILKGINANEEVVTVGNYELTNGMPLRVETQP